MIRAYLLLLYPRIKFYIFFLTDGSYAELVNNKQFVFARSYSSLICNHKTKLKQILISDLCY